MSETSEARNILNFIHKDFGDVRAIVLDNMPWFIANDICKILELTNSRKAISKLDEDEKADVTISYVSSNGIAQRRKVNAINESGLYHLIFISRKPIAKKFRKWVTDDVLPSIRKFGAYIDTNHPQIRQLSIDTCNHFKSAISVLIFMTLGNPPQQTKNMIYGILMSKVNELAGIPDGQRDAATTEQLINLIRIQSSFITTIMNGLKHKKDIYRIINSCGYDEQACVKVEILEEECA